MRVATTPNTHLIVFLAFLSNIKLITDIVPETDKEEKLSCFRYNSANV